ncbi:parallel beta-helix domain-containing protein [Altererythrobacter aquiaggeris]|uniref:parallel beta-helix domain-containing protein n=1 Tax=Aestuarierythrobacter aquiaggeris TaxID=1898396 RepID=UPI00301A3051
MTEKVNFACMAAVAAVLWTSPVSAETIRVEPGEGAQERLQEALILAEPGDEIVLGEGRFELTDGLSLDVDGVTLRGAGSEFSVLDFTAQQGAGEGLLVTSDNVTLRDFGMENPKGDGIKSKGADAIVYYKIRVEWTGGPLETNGAYAIYPVESNEVLVDSVHVSGASDAGIYVGQSTNIVVRNSVAEYNVAGIEIENSRKARVTGNFVSHNTGGILVFDLPNLPVMGGGEVLVDHNLVIDNDTINFAPKGNIVASVPMGAAMMVIANDDVTIAHNVVSGNATAGVMVVSYTQDFDDPRYNPYPREVVVSETNSFYNNGFNPQFEGGTQLAQAFGGRIPTVLWDGLGGNALKAHSSVGIVSLGLPEIGADLSRAQPAPVQGSMTEADGARSYIMQMRPEIEARITP